MTRAGHGDAPEEMMCVQTLQEITGIVLTGAKQEFTVKQGSCNAMIEVTGLKYA